MTLSHRTVSNALYRDDMSTDAGPPTRAFISYAHDSPAHREQVRSFWYFLLEHGVDAWSDFEVAEERQELPRTIEIAIDRGEFILVVASEEYRRRAAPDRPGGQRNGRGVEYEAGLIRDRLYRDRHRWFSRVLPVVLPGGSERDVPPFLLPLSATIYSVTAFTVAGAEPLLRVLTGQPGEVRPAIGRVPALPPRAAPPGSAGRVTEDLIAALGTLPAMASAEARAHFRSLVEERLGAVLPVTGKEEPDEYPRVLLDALGRTTGGLPALADAVRALHRHQPIEGTIRGLVEQLQMFS
jgi:hypothetical protein